jgi:hypothetical protein
VPVGSAVPAIGGRKGDVRGTEWWGLGPSAFIRSRATCLNARLPLRTCII